MKVVQVDEFGKPEVLVYKDAPEPVPGQGQVLIKIESAAVNFADVLRRSNSLYPFPTPLPFVPGSEVAGTIVAHGEGVSEPPIGTPVFALIGNDGAGYAQYTVAPVQQVIPRPPGLDPDVASALGVAGITPLLMLKQVARLQPGESVLVQGASGGVGSYAIQIAKILGAGKIIGATSSDAKRDTALSLGADYVVDYTQPGWWEQVLELTGGQGVDVILEMSGGKVFAESLKCLAPFGRLIVYGTASREPLAFDPASIVKVFYDPAPNQSLHVFNLGLWFGLRPQLAIEAYQEVIGLVVSGRLKVQIGQTLPLAQAAEAHRRLEGRATTGKIILKPWQETN
jgi:NADPH:quinone reductase